MIFFENFFGCWKEKVNLGGEGELSKSFSELSKILNSKFSVRFSVLVCYLLNAIAILLNSC